MFSANWVHANRRRRQLENCLTKQESQVKCSAHNSDETVARVVQLSIDLKWPIFICFEKSLMVSMLFWICLLPGKDQKNYAERWRSWQSGPSRSHYNLYPFQFIWLQNDMLVEMAQDEKSRTRNKQCTTDGWLWFVFRLCSSAECLWCPF